MATLFVMLFATLVVLATMSYNLVSLRIANEQGSAAEEQRVASAAIETMVQVLRNAEADPVTPPATPDRATLEGTYLYTAGSPDPAMPPCLGTTPGVASDSSSTVAYGNPASNVFVTCTPQETESPLERRVALKAVVGGGASSRLRASAVVRIVDVDPDPPAGTALADSFGNTVVVENMRVCKQPAGDLECAA